MFLSFSGLFRVMRIYAETSEMQVTTYAVSAGRARRSLHTGRGTPQGGPERSLSRSAKPLLDERFAAIERKANGRLLPNLTLDEGVLKIAPIENRPRRKRRNSRRDFMRCCRVRITLDPAVNFARFRRIAGKPGDDHRFRGYAGSPWGRATRAQCALIKATSPGASSTRTSPTATPPSTPSDRRNWQRGAARLGRAAVSQSEVTSVRHHTDGGGNSNLCLHYASCSGSSSLLGFPT